MKGLPGRKKAAGAPKKITIANNQLVHDRSEHDALRCFLEHPATESRPALA
jgi:hypothetical protein